MAGVMQYGWRGAGYGYDKPGACGVNIRSANQTPRWWAKDNGMSSAIMSATARNTADFSGHAGVESEAIKAYKQTFQS